MTMGMVLSSLCILALTTSGAASALGNAQETVLESFEGQGLPAALAQHNVQASLAPNASGGHALYVEFGRADWPNVYFSAPDRVWDWTGYLGLAVEVHNPGEEAVDLCCRVDNAGADGMNACNTAKTTVLPGETKTFRTYFNTGAGEGRFWGMRGLPAGIRTSTGTAIDLSRVTGYQFFLSTPARPYTLELDAIRLFGKGQTLDDLVRLPFVDRFGQYRHVDWPGKAKKERDLKKWAKAEAKTLEAAPTLPGRDAYGGWAEGPQVEATGWFRVQQVEGKWWLVTPEGHLFFSTGMDCVGTWEQTFVEGRKDWFYKLPKEKGKYAPFYGFAENVHSMADAIGGKGKTFSFYRLNLLRKYGKEWPTLWRETALARLQAWGFNTVGNWSQADVAAANRIPFTATISVGGALRRIEGGGGYWAKMPDVYDAGFATAVEAAVAPVAGAYAKNPWCLGYFVDNELSWGAPGSRAIAAGALASPADQPCRVALINRLKFRYPTIADLSRVWEVAVADWDALRAPESPNGPCGKDLDEFTYQFAHRYFDTVNVALKRAAPNQLYLGCRFAGAPGKDVLRACSEVVDVVSFNLYSRTIDCAAFSGENSLGKPAIIGEFHFGALDRGLFHPGLVETRDQQDRAESYKQYVLSVAACPSMVGCHWFQYVDEPLTGRCYDGENYNIGFVSVVDQPYPELVEKAQEAHRALYRLRYEGSPAPGK